MIDHLYTVYQQIKDNGFCKVTIARPQVIEEFPFCGLTQEENLPAYNHDNEMIGNAITFNLDLYTNTGAEAKDIVESMITLMQEIDYLLVNDIIIPEPYGKFHRLLTFKYIIQNY